MKTLPAEKAITLITPGSRVVLPHGCIEPHSLFRALGRSRGVPEAPPTLYTGMQFGDYEFLGPAPGAARPRAGETDRDPAEEAARGALGPGYRFVTWQVGPRLRRFVERGRIGILPLRFRDIPRAFGPDGPLRADAVLIQCAPPQDGAVNLGISCSIFPGLIAAARLVIAEIHPDMPRTSGATQIPLDLIDVAVDADGPLGTLARSGADAVDHAIVQRVLGLVPESAWVQLGVGAIPDLILAALGEVPGVRIHSGMLTDTLSDFLDRAPAGTRVVTGELEGSLTMYRRAAADPRVSLQPTTLTHDVPHLAQLERFVSINSALEVDLAGQVNGETIDGVQVSGVGGSLDFVEAARCSPGGRSIIALRSLAKGRSRIVPRLSAGTAVTLPRHVVDYVVTEHGVARLFGLDLEARAQALIAIAAPEAQSELERSRGRLLHERDDL
ncbi:MAG TPA: acetyl-CoA hydrolase/transferase C-terminal domain-containing protein [Candidatus Bathyarchaeia archaeon]|nr:acetyl-CoA hydrolase/transferase C-terminal domain-containing protein [Candidatus Bathyarchaeia archaeon]